MKRIVSRVSCALLLCSSILLGAYTYYHSEDLTTPNWVYWIVNGTVTASYYAAGGYGGIGSASSGAMLGPNPGGGGEVRFTVRQDPSNPGGSYYAYLSASDDALAFQSGTYYIVSVGGTPTVTIITVYKSYWDYNSNSDLLVTVGSIWTSSFHDNTTIRAVFKPGYTQGIGAFADIIVYKDNVLALTAHDTYAALIGGRTGIGVANTTWNGATGNLLSHVDLGPLDTVPPNAIPAGSIGVSAFTNHVDLQWPAGTDDVNGTGVYEYQVWRNSQLLTTTTGLSYSDTASIVPSTTYIYTLTVLDYHLNATNTNFSVTTPHILTNPPFPSATPEGRRVGVRSTGAYWGAGGENIDVRSSNLNFTLPLLSALSRGGGKVGFNLTYNSQNWRQDSGGTWNFGSDVGYGFGWKLLAGSITPVWNVGGFTAAYYLFTDSTGAEYRLDQNNNNLWSSKESIYIYFDANITRLHFRDGSFWDFGCVSAGTEADSGVMHPTRMEDTNGNQILIGYMQAPGASWANSSARITLIEDVRANGQGIPPGVLKTYYFTYNSDPIPHLTSINNTINTGEAFTFAYLQSQALASPINSQSFGTTTLLNGVTVATLGATHSFVYDGGGEVTKITVPYGGYFAYDYESTAYSSGRTFREVVRRYLSKDGTSGSQTTYSFNHEPTPGPDVHQYTVLDDPSDVGEKYWAFATTGLAEGLLAQYQGRHRPGPVTKTQNDLTWTQDAVGNSYISSTLTTIDPSQPYQAQSKTDQTVDIYGNVTQVNKYNYGNLTTPVRTYNYTYLSAYPSLYIYNRLSQASVTSGSTNVTLAQNTYDVGGLVTVSGLREWDSAYGSVTTRGNVTTSVTPSGTSGLVYDQAGNVTSTTVNGVMTQVSTSSTNNYAAPTQITTGGLINTMTWSSFLGLTNETGPNGDSAGTLYDQYARPSSSTSPFGAQTTVTYNNPPFSLSTPATVTTTVNGVNGRWTRNTLDGLGRAIKVETGDANGTKSVAESVYGPCGCSPIGKLIQQAVPHAPASNPAWTTYTYDGIGRTLSVVAPDGASTSSYIYEGNTVKTIDAALKWKLFTMDALGNLTQVVEPDPSVVGQPAPTAAAPSFSVASGTYSAAQTVTITSTSGASIRYTINSGTPTETSGTLYTAPINVSGTSVVNAIAYVSGMNDSPVASASYTITGFTPIRLNVGGPDYTDSLEQQWTADTASYNVYTTSNPVGNTTAAPLYQTERWYASTMQYQFTVPNATYTVNLSFAEIYFTQPGSRIFNIVINGTAVQTNFDVLAAAGGPNLAVDRFYSVPVTNGQITIQFVPVTQNPTISAIEIVQQSGGLGLPTQVTAPAFSVVPGSYTSSQSVALSTTTSGAAVRYTLDGTTPSATYGTMYSGSITVSSTTTVKAIAYASGLTNSPVTSAAYTISAIGNGQTFTTTYTYDLLSHLTQVSMPRASGTQTRTFNYNNGAFLQSATNPENGTVSYTYNPSGKVATKTDQKGQQIVYTYDGLTRLTIVQRYPTVGNEDTCQKENYYYDTNTFDSNYSQYPTGRLTAVQYHGGGAYAGGPCNTTFTEMFSYSQPGGRVGKRLRLQRTGATNTVDLNSTYTYDNEGRMTAAQYPQSGPNLGYGYDTMGRLNTMTDLTAQTSIMSGVVYSPPGQMLSMTGLVTETRTYNSMLQMTQLQSNGVNMTYAYSPTQNNGKITSQTDTSGEQVVYTYDALNRLASATATSYSWGQSYNYDGFGNLTDQIVTHGSAPAYSVVYSASTNRIVGEAADANGNIGYTGIGTTKLYDVENRLASASLDFSGNAYEYSYAAGNKRVWRGVWTNGTLTTDEVTFWSASGQKLATYQLTVTGQTLSVTQTATNYYFGGKLIKNASGYIGTDRLGSIGKYYPWGQEKGTGNPASGEKFTGYFRDVETGLDYADQRYHSPGTGRFMTPDPSMDSADYLNPGSWNAYAYVNGDPINLVDPDGLTACGDFLVEPTGGTVRDQINANTAQGHFMDLVWHEAGFLSQAGGNVGVWAAEFELIAQAIWDRYQLVSGNVQVTGANGVVYGGGNVSVLGYGAYGSSLNQVLINAAAGTNPPVLNSQGQLIDNASLLQADLNQDQGNLQYAAGRVALTSSDGSQIWVTQGCYSVIAAMESANSVAAGTNFNPQGMFITSWNSSAPVNNPNYAAGVEQLVGKQGPTNLYGFTSFTYGHFAPPPRRPRPPSRPRGPGGPRQVQ